MASVVEGDRSQAVLATIALEGYSDLNSLLQDPSITAPVRQAILQRLADVIQLVHRHRLQHNSLGGNHVLIKMEENDGFDLRILNPGKHNTLLQAHRCCRKGSG